MTPLILWIKYIIGFKLKEFDIKSLPSWSRSQLSTEFKSYTWNFVWNFDVEKSKEVWEISRVYFKAGWKELTAVIKWVSSSLVDEVALR